VAKLQNVEYSVENGVLLIKVKLHESYGPSKSQKTIVVGTTGGFEYLQGAFNGYMFSLNVNKK